MTPLTSGYDYDLVVLSVLIAILAAGTALDLAARVTVTHGRARVLWLTAGSLAMGLGIWSMHYTGMLAFQLPVPVRYHVPTVALSLLAAVLASAVALYVASRDRLDVGRTIKGSLAMGSGIAAMHYTGMAAMRLAATTRWDILLVAASVVIAVLVSAVALWFAFHYGHAAAERWTWRKVGSAALMGLAIPAMHYTGMAAAAFRAAPDPGDAAQTVSISQLGAYAIAAATLLTLTMAIGTSLVSRYGEERLRASEARFRALAGHQEILLSELQASAAAVKVLQGILPICANCKRIRNKAGGWEQVESYVRDHTNAEFSHGICPDCAKKTWS